MIFEDMSSFFKTGETSGPNSREFELPAGSSAQGGREVDHEPAPAKSLLALLGTLSPIEDEFHPIADPFPDPVELMRYLLDTNIVSDLVRKPTRPHSGAHPHGR